MEIKKIYRYPLIKKIVWTATTVCNFHCSYCPEELHDGKYRWPKDYSKLLNFINKWRGDDELTLDILGGEPTLWPDLTKFCHDLKSSSNKNTKIIFSSNGARSLGYWKNFDAPINDLGLSYHPEYNYENHFLDVVKILHEKYSLTVFLMLVPPYIDKVKNMFESLKDYKVRASVNRIVDKVESLNTKGLVDPTEEYKDFANNNYFDNSIKSNFTQYRTYITDGQKVEPTNTQILINNGQDNFKNWKCFIGKDTLYIHQNGDIFGSCCSAGPCYGNINDLEEIEFTPDPIICPNEFCGCGTDIEIEKIKDAVFKN